MLTAKEESYNQLILAMSNKWDIVGDLSFCHLSHLVKLVKERKLGKWVNISSLSVWSSTFHYSPGSVRVPTASLQLPSEVALSPSQ